MNRPSYLARTPWMLRRSATLILLPGLLLAQACGEDATVDPGTTPEPEGPPTGQTSFVSADGQVGQDSGENDFDSGAGAPEADDGGRGEDERTVEEGDIYRVLGNGLILNLNAYRGLQIIDFSDVSNPQVVGRLAVTGSPVELYVVDDTAYVLMNNWQGYYGNRADVRVETRTGGLVMAVDLSNPEAPVEVSRSFIPGYIQTSRVTREGDRAALYAVANWYGEWTTADGSTTWESHVAVKSFEISEGGLTDRSLLDLGGYVSAVQATPEALLVARSDWRDGTTRSLVSVVDISNVDGSMIEGDQVQVAGWVQNKFNMDVYNDVLRVVSTDTWGGTNTNHVQTFDASDIQNLTLVDDETFGDGMQLFATLFLGNKAFFVTYFRVDPFHAFEITDEGDATEISEFIVSGWNNYFRPVFDDTRLIGIGVNDEGSTTMSVSLYDITDLANPEPMLARAEVNADSSWSEAQWDDRAFSVVEGAVNIAAPDGTMETGLVLLPYSGWDSEEETYEASVQIYTFSDTTLTRRGTMDHGTQVRRSFLADDALTANLSEAEISFFDTSNPDSPAEAGRVELAPNYTDVIMFGDYAVRIKDSSDYYYGWWGSRVELPASEVQVIPADGNLDMAEPIAAVGVPAGSTIYQAGNLLVALRQQYEYTDDSDSTNDFRSTVTIIDMSTPTAPRVRGSLTTTDLQPYYGGYWGWGMEGDCFDCRGGYYGRGGEGVYATTNALSFLQPVQQNEFLGREEICNRYVNYRGDCAGDETTCEYIHGGITCRTSQDSDETWCTGSFQSCEYNEDGNWICEEIAEDGLDTEEYCYTNDNYRYWNQYTFRTIDLTSPDAPALRSAIELPATEEGVSVLASGDSLYASYRIPTDVDGDSRPFVRYFVREVNIENPATPVLESGINVPGELLSINDDVLYTRDTTYGDSIVEAVVARLKVFEGRAYLQGRYQFEDQQVDNILLDGEGHVLASHRLAWNIATSDTADSNQRMTILNAETLAPVSTLTVDAWATLTAAASGRALFSVPGGMLMVNVEDATNPYAQAYFPTLGWPQDTTVSDGRLIFAAGRYGIYEFSLDAFNLLPPM
jgi:hypothetical protein